MTNMQPLKSPAKNTLSILEVIKLNRIFLVLGFVFSDDLCSIFLLLIHVLLICFKISFNRLSSSFIGVAYVSFCQDVS
jgi:hypothetical protein